MIRQSASPLSRSCARLALAAALTAGLSSVLHAQERRPATGQPARAQQPAQPTAEPPKPVLVANVGDWSVYVATNGRDRQCYALAQPKDRAPSNLKRDPAYLFISSRPAEEVRHEISIIMGFDVKADNKAPPEAQIGSDKFVFSSQGSHLWLRDTNRAGAIVDSLRKGQRLTVKATSLRGNLTTDTYSLTGLAGALDRVQKECP